MIKYVCLGILAMMLVGCAATQPVPWVSTPEYEVEYDLAWDLTVGLIREHFTIETAEKSAGLIQTAWKSVEYPGTKGNTLQEIDRVGVRITCQVEGRFPFQLKFKVERGVLRSGEWVPVWVDYSRESICQRCEAGRDWIDEDLEREILRELSVRLQN